MKIEHNIQLNVLSSIPQEDHLCPLHFSLFTLQIGSYLLKRLNNLKTECFECLLRLQA